MIVLRGHQALGKADRIAARLGQRKMNGRKAAGKLNRDSSSGVDAIKSRRGNVNPHRSRPIVGHVEQRLPGANVLTEKRRGILRKHDPVFGRFYCE